MMATPGGAGGDGGPSLFPPPPPASPPDRYASLWRLVHFAVALGLGCTWCCARRTRATRAEREQAELAHRVGLATDQDAFQRYFFWAFGTAETVLLTSRFFVDRGRAPPRGMLWTAAGFLPEPFKGNAEMVLRYGQILARCGPTSWSVYLFSASVRGSRRRRDVAVKQNGNREGGRWKVRAALLVMPWG